ncbi:diguanylate cyclase/phosphodiesterase with PAS/PAC sensor(s) [Psychromonas ingrahamii 37]|uniref:cyclic-guanylate-specific phosphodiesterase n=1 Tax=Psychromonas ingrahamii (strain DSM 17664 / CCUG 51855 / 37) TaxID=357804 RepID=A1SZA9_PSYIN|nr:bifunctional diguanylate cyclase/phosphodiesterase [Psychromonas ingrahamii]ABM04824.1 diguanylate cyclase/phosphodiesterase with PAS/PAC sensor(s) [Psychromonas ingrahamii 37]
MKTPAKSTKLSSKTLRRRAEAQLKTQTEIKQTIPSDYAAKKMIHELQVHQIELEMQNEELKQARIAEKLHYRYTELFEFAPIGYFSFNLKGVINQVNLRGASLLDIERANLVGKQFSNCLTAQDRNKFNRCLAKAFAGDGIQSFEVLAQVGKHKCWLNIEANLGITETDCLAAVIDITDRKRADEELLFQNDEKGKRTDELVIANKELFFQNAEKEKRVGELRVAATVFETQEGMFVTDANLCILRVNKAFTNISGYSGEEVIGQSPKLFNSGRQDKAFYKEMWNSINTTDAWRGEVSNRSKSGDIYAKNLTITAVRDGKGVVSNYVATFRDITTSKAASEKINNLAYFDPLTQLPNRRMLLDSLRHVLTISARSNQHCALLFLDLDNFKTLNDTLGHDVGDLLLQQVATRLTDCVREGDIVARLGGDEFVVLLENLSLQAIEAANKAKKVAKKIIFELAQYYQLNMHRYHSTTSIGVTIFSGNETGIEELLKQADIAMYQSKAAGRNTWHFFNKTMQESIIARADMERDLRKAIEDNQFQLHYQAQVSSSGQTLGAEALIRWQHPERGQVSPFNFIPLAEETGLILPIGQWVLDSACAQLKAWQKNPLTQDLVLAVNISAKQLHQEDFVEQVKATLKRHDINPARLKLELTESMLVENISDIITKMNILSKIGISFSLDDFGTGYSSLQYLKKLPLNQIKIDQSFVRDLITDASDRAIVRTIITMSHSLDISVIAEGVETVEERQYLLDNGCTHYQGYLFSKPVPINEFEVLLKKG